MRLKCGALGTVKGYDGDTFWDVLRDDGAGLRINVYDATPLDLAAEPLKKGDLVLIYGHDGWTYRVARVYQTHAWITRGSEEVVYERASLRGPLAPAPAPQPAPTPEPVKVKVSDLMGMGYSFGVNIDNMHYYPAHESVHIGGHYPTLSAAIDAAIAHAMGAK